MLRQFKLLVLVWFCCFKASGVHLEMHKGQRHFVVDLHGEWRESEHFLLEINYGNAESWQLAGVFRRPANQEMYWNNYSFWYEHTPELRWLEPDKDKLLKLYESKRSSVALDELEPIRDRLFYAAMGFSLLIPQSGKMAKVKLRLKRPDGSEVAHYTYYGDETTKWPELYLSSYEVHGHFPSLSWKCLLGPSIQGFKVYRGVEFQNQFQELKDARISVSVSGDTLLCMVQDTSTSIAGIFQYYIKLVDVAGNEGPASPMVRLPHMSHIPRPIVTYLEVKGLDDQRANRLKWEIASRERVRYIAIWRKDPESPDWHFLTSLPPDANEYKDPLEVVNEVYLYQLRIGDLVLDKEIVSEQAFGLSTAKSILLVNLRLEAENVEKGVQVKVNIHEALHLAAVYILRGENYDPEFQVISPRIDLESTDSVVIWVDTLLSNMKPQIPYAYSVLLVSDAYEFFYASDTAFVWPKVKMELVAPRVFMRELSDDGKAKFAWTHSDFDETPIREFQVFKVDKNGNLSNEPAAVVPGEQNVVYLEQVADGAVYRLRAIHWLGDAGPWSDTIRLQLLKKTLEEVPLWIRFKNSHPVLTWPKMENAGVVHFELYRQDGDKGSVIKIATLEGDINQYEDALVPLQTHCYYSIQAVFKDGHKSPMSEPLFFKQNN